MAKEFFKNLPDTSTPLNASRLNGLLNGNEAMGNIVVGDVRCKNVIPNNATSQTTNGITVTVNSDKSITLSGKSTSTSETLIMLTNSMNLSLPSGSYTFSFGNPLPGGVRFEAWHEAATQFAYIGSGNSKGSVNITSDLSNFRTLLAISSGATVNTTIKYMLEEGTSATEYAPYKAFGIESGSNENGSWVKFEDGTMICRGQSSIDIASFTQIASGINYSEQQSLPFPQQFISDGDIGMSVTSRTANFSWIVNVVPTTTDFVFTIINSATVQRNVFITWTAIGRWK